MTLTLVPKFDRPAKTERGLIRKINRRLPTFHQLHKARPHQLRELGDYFIVDHYHNSVVESFICDLQDYLEELDMAA